MDDIIAEAGEALTVGDSKEAWVFHILPDDTGRCVCVCVFVCVCMYAYERRNEEEFKARPPIQDHMM